MELTCVAIDDEPLALDVISAYVKQNSQLRLLQVFEDAITGGEYLRNHPVDLLLIDIHMPDISGLDLVRSLSPRPMIIFTTAHRKFAYESYELEAIDYLLKPISPGRFKKAVSKALDYASYLRTANNNTEEALYVYAEYRLVKIPLQDIEYIESLEDYVKIVLQNGESVMTLMTLKSLAEKLPDHMFQRIHRSFIVAVNKVQSIQKRKACLRSGTDIPISDSYVHFIENWKKNR